MKWLEYVNSQKLCRSFVSTFPSKCFKDSIVSFSKERILTLFYLFIFISTERRGPASVFGSSIATFTKYLLRGRFCLSKKLTDENHTGDV